MMIGKRKAVSRREVLIGAGTLALAGCSRGGGGGSSPTSEPLYRISLAQWSLHRRLFGGGWRDAVASLGGDEFRTVLRNEPERLLRGEMSNLDFPVVARREFGIDAVEYVNSFFFDKAEDEAYLNELNARANGEGVRNLLIMCDNEGHLGDPDAALREQAVIDHSKWLHAAAALGCHCIRVDASSTGTPDEQLNLVADGLHALCDRADSVGIDVVVENHGGISSNGSWVASLIRAVDHPRLGTLPDFGNFNISETERYDPYLGIEEMMPFAKAVSAKSYDFDDTGDETTLDYRRLLRTVVESGYRGYVGIEYEGNRLSEADGIRATHALVERVREELASEIA